MADDETRPGEQPTQPRDPGYEQDLKDAGGDPTDEYRWHTGAQRPTGVPDAVEFVDVHKAFGRNKILRGSTWASPRARSR